MIKFIIVMKIYHGNENLSYGDMRSTTKLTNFAFLSLAVFAHFDTFPDGWLGKKSRIKTNSA